jgi:secreted Zn-dependent insulinase-like peptidase
LYNGNPESDTKLSDLLGKYNGDSNAVTNDMETEYFFTVEKHFEKAVRLWSKGFNGASFSPEDIRREVLLLIPGGSC